MLPRQPNIYFGTSERKKFGSEIRFFTIEYICIIETNESIALSCYIVWYEVYFKP